MNKVCQAMEDKATAGRVLNIQNDNTEYKSDIHDEFEALKRIIEKRITKEQLEAILKKEEEEAQRRLVQIFKETRPDQIDPDFFKNKIKMTTVKKLNEAQDQQY